MKKLTLVGKEKLSIIDAPEYSPVEETAILKVEACGVCRTDAKMWKEGHRDLVFPRVPGHEVTGRLLPGGPLYTLWPGTSCGTCRYCRSGRENLCEDMKILGFHSDGGYADYVQVPLSALQELPAGVSAETGTFAEPLGCVINAIHRSGLHKGDRVIIYGGGTVGLLFALAVKEMGGIPRIIERSELKIEKSRQFRSSCDLEIVKDTSEADFDIAVNACAEPAVFNMSITKLRKGGKLVYFSGMNKNDSINTNLLNLVHYKEIDIRGSYGLRTQDLAESSSIMVKYNDSLKLLIEKIIPMHEIEDAFNEVYRGDALRYVAVPDFNKTDKDERAVSSEYFQRYENIPEGDNMKKIIKNIKPTDKSIKAAVQHKIDLKTKPLGSLGMIEDLALKMSLIQKNSEPDVSNKGMIVFAADHGITEEGISAYPSDVTPQMVTNFLEGGAAINAFCKTGGIKMSVVDIGVKGEFSPHEMLMQKKVRPGTRNFAVEPAMTAEEAEQALQAGADAFNSMYEKYKLQIVGLGEMGIGNTTSATAVIAAVSGLPVSELTGRGTGVDDKGLEHKIDVIEKALSYHKPDGADGIDLLCKVGGYELAGMAGAALAAAEKGVAVVFDGIISTAAALIAWRLNSAVIDYAFSGHKSVEAGQKTALELLGLRPIIDYNMRLGEGTGAAIAMHTIDNACAFIRDMASFEDAGISEKL